MKILCIHHAGCADGFTAATIVQHHIEGDIELLPAQYGDEAPDVTGKAVYIVDFSYPSDVLLRMKEQAESLVVIDHHQTAQAACEGLDFCTFDMTKCGAVLTWEHFSSEPVPLFLKYVQDRDLWQWKLPQSKEFSAGLTLLKKEVGLWASHIFSDDLLNNLIDCGVNVLEYQNQCVKSQAKRAYMTEIAGYTVPTINCTHLVSEIGNELCKGHPFAAMYFDTEDKRIYSLRSNESGIDVSEVASSFEGGGGHKHAAGFFTNKPNLPIK